jgi:hypothetical protein
MTNEYLSLNDDEGSVSRDSLHRYIVFALQRLIDLTRRSHSPFAWYALASGERRVLRHCYRNLNAPKKSISPR